MFETFDHTADLGLRIRAADLDTLFVEAARALFSVIVDNPEAIQPAEMLEVHIAGERDDDLLFDWLRELLYRFDGEHRLFSRFEAHRGESGLSSKAWGEPYDPERHQLGHEVKAITYHGLRVEKTGDGWLAEVIVDI